MKKLLTNFILLVLILLILVILTLSTIGIETSKFNNLISSKVSKDENILLSLDSIKFKFNLKELSLFLETKNPKITYRKINVPVKNIKLYIDFLTLIKAETIIKKASLSIEEIDISQINELSGLIKPSNFKSILNNKIKKGKLISKIEFFFSEQGSYKDFIAKGSVTDLEAKLSNNIYLKKTNFNFIADKKDILAKNIFGNLDDVVISEGDIKINLENGIKLNSNFNSSFELNDQIYSKYSKFLNEFKFFNDLKKINANFDNSIFIDLDSTYKVTDYNYRISGIINNCEFQLEKPFKNDYLAEDLKKIYISDLKIDSNLEPKKVSLNGEGKYSFNNTDFQKIDFKNDINKDIMNLKLNLEYNNSFEFDLINYKKPQNTIANLYLDVENIKDNLNINKLHYQEGKNLIKINELKFKKNKFLSFQKIEVTTKNNEFIINKEKKIRISGNKFDGTNLAKFFLKKGNKNELEKLSSKIEIDFKEIKAPMAEKIKDFRLIGEIKNGKFVRISSKGDYGGNNYLDISMKNVQNSNKKYLEIYSDLTRPLLTEYNFFNGLTGGKLLFTSIIDGSKSNSKIKIENFKVVNAPGMVQLLSLADLRGLADLAEGEGLSFDLLEINMQKDENFLKLNEILALGPSMSVIMEGYRDSNGLTSLRGTLVPAKTLNKMISKIPVIGDIVIPKEVGEGLFGISFKMKGPAGNIKTTINPIKTLTPRFIQKIIEKNKEIK